MTLLQPAQAMLLESSEGTHLVLQRVFCYCTSSVHAHFLERKEVCYGYCIPKKLEKAIR